MRILVTNDDGIYSPGLSVLTDALQKVGEVTVVAPDIERSAVGHSITLSHPLRVKEVKRRDGFFGYAVNGTPADCVKIALGALMDTPADLVVAGINHGLNLGTNILYSGTVSGAMEGAIFGLPALAISAEVDKGTENGKILSLSATFTVKLVRMIYQMGLPERTLLNVNFPSSMKNGLRGAVITKQGQTKLRDRFQKRVDPRNDIYYWLEGEDIEMEGGEELDYTAIKKGYISITPIWCDLTHNRYMDILKEWDIPLSSITS